MMEPMKEMQKIMNEGKEETGVVRGVETIRSGSPDLPLLAAWEPQQGPLILGDWLLLVEPIVADLSLSAAEWWKALIHASEQWYKRRVSLSPLDRIKHPVEAAEIQQEKWQRLERRVAQPVREPRLE